MLETKKINNITIYEQLKEIILERIKKKELKPLDKIPSEYELAKEYNVSRITANRAISELVAEGLLYRVHGRGTFVVDNPDFSKGSKNIAVVFFNLSKESDTFLSTVIRTVNEVAVVYEYNIQIYSANNKELFNKENPFFENLIISKKVDGLLFANPLEKREMVTLQEKGIPFVMMDAVDNINDCKELKVSCVIRGDYQAGYAGTNYLINQGNKYIGIVKGLLIREDGKIFLKESEFLKGYKKALEEHKIHPDSIYIKEYRYGENEGYNSAKELLELPNRPTAIFTDGDTITVGVIKAIKEAGLNIPKDVVLLNYADSPALTSLNILKPISQIARTGIDMLIKIISKEKIEKPIVEILPVMMLNESKVQI